jgi:hypothetical protein
MFFQRQFQNSESTMGLTDRLSVEMYEDIWYKHFSTSIYSRFLFSTARNYREAHPVLHRESGISNFGILTLVLLRSAGT